MAKSSRKRPGPASATPPRTPASRPDASDGSGDDAAAYLETLVQSGQAVVVRPGEPLPPGATHAIVKDDDGEVRVVRRRFSIG